MPFKNLSIIFNTFISLLFIFILSSFAKTNYDDRVRVLPFANKMTPLPPPAPPLSSPTPTPEPVISTETLPVISFIQSEVTLDLNLEARLGLQLSEASKQPVIITVNLVNGTALHYRDFAGFKVKSAEVSQTVIFPPGTTRVNLPVIGGRHTRFCDTYFLAKINLGTQPKARVLNDTAKINVPCTFAEPTEPAPIVIPPPEPRVEPCPPVVAPSPQTPINVRFERERIDTQEHAKRVAVKIILDSISSLPITIELETQDGSAFDQVDYNKIKVQLTIPPGQNSIELPIELIKAHRCKSPELQGRETRFEFRLVATAIYNANMINPATIITVKKDIDDDRGCLSAPVSVPKN